MDLSGHLKFSPIAAKAFLVAVCGLCASNAAEPEHDKPAMQSIELNGLNAYMASMSASARNGYRHLTESVYLPADLDEEVAKELERGTQASFNEAHADARLSPRSALLARYGLTPRPGDSVDHPKPLQYVVDSQSRWAMNCFACHGGSVYGTTWPGAPNNTYELQTFVEDIRDAKIKLGKPLGHMEIGSVFMPLGTNTGTTNAVMFGVALMHFRDADLNVLPPHSSPPMVHHDMDPPAWWLLKKKQRIYVDGFAQKGHRGLMQFMLVRENGPEKFRGWENDFKDVLTYIESIQPPKFPHAINLQLAEKGRLAFNDHCSRCHGTYGAGPEQHYAEVVVPIDDIGTDRVRLDALSSKHREAYGQSWFAHYGEQETWDSPEGYVAPPLDGIWASPPYFHNGSVPTLWHVLHPEDRPVVWTRTATEMDTNRIGLMIQELDRVPKHVRKMADKRHYFDTRKFGKSADGHDYPNELNEAEKDAVLEYLKTL